MKYALIRQEAQGNTRVTGRDLCNEVSAASGRTDVKEQIPKTLTEIYAASDDMLTINRDLSFSFAKTAEYEKKIAENITRLDIAREESDITQEAYIKQAEKMLKVTYSDEQRAVFSLLRDGGVKLLTGGPGTGKTLTIAGIVKSYLAYHPEKKCFYVHLPVARLPG